MEKQITVSTTGTSKPHEVIGPVYFQVSNKGIFSSALKKYVKKHTDAILEMRKQGQASGINKMDWSWLYGELSFGMENDFDKAFFIAVRELQERAAKLGADAIVGMRQDIDMDTNQFQSFYLQMYGTAIRYI